jgi:2-polyprenyl-6-methoxyphenol hydroxylase-like FAD-dependent oxidoreductase
MGMAGERSMAADRLERKGHGSAPRNQRGTRKLFGRRVQPEPVLRVPQNTTCCIVGGGPAGMMLGYLLARAGISVTVLEKHKDFLRDFRGDTVHPSTLELMDEIGLLDELLKLPHQRLTSTGGMIGNFAFQVVNFSRLPTRCKFVALMPQWDFLNFLSRHASEFPSFDLRMEHEAVDLLWKNGRVVGVEVQTPAGPQQIRAHLVVGCDGRHSTLRTAAKLEVEEFGVPIDVLWFRISRSSHDPEQLLGNFNYGGALILIPRGEYFQAGLLIRKNSFDELKRGGMNALRDRMLRIAPYLRDRVNEMQDWEQIKLLSVRINRLRQWFRPGLLCIGDAAHAMSPVGGVGINLAIQDAVAAANLLTQSLQDETVTELLLTRVQKRREFPARATQFVQMNAHKVMDRVFQNTGPIEAPWQLKAAVRVPGLQHALGRAVGIGVRPEHVAAGKSRLGLRRICLSAVAVCAGTLLGTIAVRRHRSA